MEAHAEKASKAVKAAEKRLQNALMQKGIDYATLETLLEKCRVKTAELALTHFFKDESARDTENRLWTNHIDVNGKYKTWLKTFREETGRKRPVEKRKAEQRYIDFIKASQHFFRVYIIRIAGFFTNIPKVSEVAQKLNKGSYPAEHQKRVSDHMRTILEQSCEQSVIRLGDLSRWRETHLDLKDRNWGPAKGYYQLALSLNPGSGLCFNQLAVIAQNVNDHVGTVFYTFRAITAGTPFPTAIDNLRLEFAKVSKLNIEQGYGLMDRTEEDDLTILEKKFLDFHARCFREPADFVAFQQKASDILGQITLSFQEGTNRALDSFLDKAFLINISAEHLAKEGMLKYIGTRKLTDQEQAQEIERSCQSYFLYQRFNIMTFQSLLRILAREIGDVLAGQPEPKGLSSLPASARRALPYLRQYSSWLLSNMQALLDSRYKSTRAAAEQLLRVYVQTLNAVRSSIDVFAPSSIGYLLEEDVATLSFLPFSPIVCRWRHLAPDGSEKVKWTDPGHGRELVQEFAEAHLRATDLVVDALRLWKQKDDLELTFVPIDVVNLQFVALNIPAPRQIERPVSPPKQLWRAKAHAQTTSMNGLVDPAIISTSIQGPDQSAQDIEVGQLAVQTNGPHASLPNHTNGVTQHASNQIASPFDFSGIQTGTPALSSGKLTAMDIVRQMQQSPVRSNVISKSPELLHRTSQSSISQVYNTTSTTSKPEDMGSPPQSLNVQRLSPSIAIPHLTSSALFNETMQRQRQDIQQRSSPQSSFQPSLGHDTFGPTPTGANTMLAAFENHDRLPSPFSSHGQGTQSRSASQAPFGVIGQARLGSRGTTPTNGQG